ncbi:hypothetical protein TWF281_010489 [Arthrobotrys megalospora]
MTYKYESSPYYCYTNPNVVLIVGTGEEKTTVEVHESVLAPPSDFFRAALNIGLKETHERKIELPDITWEGMEEVLNWLYREEIWRPTIQDLFSENTTSRFLAIFTAIDFLQIPALKQDYQDMFEKLLDGQNEYSCMVTKTEEGRRAAFTLHELYDMGVRINENVFASTVKRLRNPRPRDRHGFLGFRNFINDLESPDPDFLHDVCRAYGACL